MRACVTFPETVPIADNTNLQWKGKPKDSEKTGGLGSKLDVWPLPEDTTGAPRLTSTHAVILGKWVREQGALTLMQAVANSTIVPAKRIEEHVSQFRTKGRLQDGMDADITVFDPKTVKANATYTKPVILNDEFYHTIVNGQFVLKNGDIVMDALPGRAILRT